MFQGMFRKRGRPPEQLPIGGYEKPTKEKVNKSGSPISGSFGNAETATAAIC